MIIICICFAIGFSERLRQYNANVSGNLSKLFSILGGNLPLARKRHKTDGVGLGKLTIIFDNI